MGYFVKFLYLFFIINVSAQNIIIKYDITLVKHKFEVKNNKIGNDVVSAMYQQASKDISKYPIEFISSPYEYSVDFSKSLQVDYGLQQTRTSKQVTLSFSGLEEHIYNIDQKSYTENEFHIVEFDLNSLSEWTLTDEIKTIIGFKCFKAIFNIKVDYLKDSMLIPIYAWYTPDLNFKGGPTIFGNLPGPILELKTKFATFKAISVQETKKSPKKLSFKSKRIMTFMESEKFFKKIYEKQFGN
jgi:GLPGLI family protein